MTIVRLVKIQDPWDSISTQSGTDGPIVPLQLLVTPGTEQNKKGFFPSVSVGLFHVLAEPFCCFVPKLLLSLE